MKKADGDCSYNIFVYVDDNVISAIGVVVHDIRGRDDEKLKFLRSRTNLDCHAARRFPLERPLPWGRYEAMMRVGSYLAVFEPMFAAIGAPIDPLVVITPIVDGYPSVQAVTDLGPINIAELKRISEPERGQMDDYLRSYMGGGGFDIPRLLNDDYFEAIKLLFNRKKHVSGSKLLVSFIDTISFVEYGDVPRSFQKWLETYADLTRLGVSADELWEYRNSLLHMSNLASRSVRSGKVDAVIPYVGPEGRRFGGKFLNLLTLISVVVGGVEKWIITYNATPGKILEFIERYDLVISDARMTVVNSEEPQPSEAQDS